MTETAIYEIRVREVLDEKWTAYFAPFTLAILRDLVHNQAELFGILLKIRDLELKLVAVNPIRQPESNTKNEPE